MLLLLLLVIRQALDDQLGSSWASLGGAGENPRGVHGSGFIIMMDVARVLRLTQLQQLLTDS
jgi:hypothetical protein